MNLASVVLGLAPETISVRRGAAVTVDVNGIVQTGSSTTLTMRASVQPLNGKDLQYLPEGSFAKDAQAVFTVAPLQTLDEQTGTPPDVVTRANGAVYRVISVQDWSNSGAYYRSLILKQVGT
jgi:hypothetical protein